MKFFLLIISCLFFLVVRTQVDVRFVQHLSVNGLKTEHFAYLQTKGSYKEGDTLAYHWSKYFLQYGQAEELIQSVGFCKNFFVADTSFSNAVSRFFLLGPEKHKNVFFPDIIQQQKKSFYTNQMFNLFKIVAHPKITDTVFVPQRLHFSFKNFQETFDKKPAMAGFLSAVLPGSGKLYVGRPKSFFNVLFAHVLYGLSVYESNRKLGLKNPYTVFCISYSGLFYLANIYGSYHDTKRAKQEKRNQFLHDASNYYKIYCRYPDGE